MPLDNLAEIIGLDGWLLDGTRLAQELRSTEAMIALTAGAALLSLWMVRRVRRHGGDCPFGDEYVPIRVTSAGPIRVGLPAQLSVVGDRSAKPLPGVVECLDKHQLTFQVAPSDAGSMRPGIVVEAMMASQTAAFRFLGTMRDCRRDDSALLLCFPRPDWVERVQRRSYYRVPMKCPAIATVLDGKGGSGSVVRGVLCELSGGGITVFLPVSLPIGSLLRVRSTISQLGETSYEVRVLRSSPVRRASVKTWEVGCEFLWMDEEARERIARACFEIQRAARASEQSVDREV